MKTDFVIVFSGDDVNVEVGNDLPGAAAIIQEQVKPFGTGSPDDGPA